MNFKKWMTVSPQDFWNLANLQRGEPEDAMLKVQFAMAGGILNRSIKLGKTYPSRKFDEINPSTAVIRRMLVMG